MQENFDNVLPAESRSFNIIPPPLEEQEQRKDQIEGLFFNI